MEPPSIRFWFHKGRSTSFVQSPDVHLLKPEDTITDTKEKEQQGIGNTNNSVRSVLIRYTSEQKGDYIGSL